MREILFRCSSLGHLMTEPRTKADGDLSAGARTYLRQLVKQEIFSVDFEISGKEIEKGLAVENESIALLNKVRGLALVKNTERRDNGLITGECDLFNPPKRRGHDLKSSWSLKTFPGWAVDCVNPLYEWQMRGYMMLWDANEWEVNYAMVNTPEALIRNEPMDQHLVDHIPPQHRLTTWVIERDFQKESLIRHRCEAARWYYGQLIREFDAEHRMDVIDVEARFVTPPTTSKQGANPAAKAPAAPVLLPTLF